MQNIFSNFNYAGKEKIHTEDLLSAQSGRLGAGR